MARYPIEIPLKPYSGTNDQKRQKAGELNRAAVAVQTYLNAEMAKADRGSRVFENYDIAKALGLDVGTVGDVMGMLGFNNGITLTKE